VRYSIFSSLHDPSEILTAWRGYIVNEERLTYVAPVRCA